MFSVTGSARRMLGSRNPTGSAPAWHHQQNATFLFSGNTTSELGTNIHTGDNFVYVKLSGD